MRLSRFGSRNDVDVESQRSETRRQKFSDLVLTSWRIAAIDLNKLREQIGCGMCAHLRCCSRNESRAYRQSRCKPEWEETGDGRFSKAIISAVCHWNHAMGRNSISGCRFPSS